MATNKEQLDAVFAGLYDGNNTPERLAKLVAASTEQLTDEQVAAKYGPTVTTVAGLNANQKAFFVLERLRATVKQTIQGNELRKSQQTQRAAQQAARQAARDAANGF